MGHSGDDAVHKIPRKMKCIGRISWKFWYWINLKFSIELDVKKIFILVQCPFKRNKCGKFWESCKTGVIQTEKRILRVDKILKPGSRELQKRSKTQGGHSAGKRGYQARPWTHKKHPKHIFPRLKFTSLNKYSSGIWHPKQVFFFNPKQVIMQ